MRNTAIGLGAIALTALGGGAAQAGTLWIANMTSAKENPPNGAGFSGTGFIVLNDAETQASVTATHDIPANQLTGGHIHRGPVGVNGPIIFPFANPASPVGPLIWAIPTADVGNLKAGGLYMNFHTAAFPGGVIRDQFGRVLFSGAATSSSQRAVGTALDVSAGFSSDLDRVLFATAVLPQASQAAVLQDLGGDTLYSQGRLQTENMHGFQETIFQHVETGPPPVPGGFSLFGAFDATWGTRDAREGQAGSDLTRQSVLAGGEYAWDAGRAGLAIGYAHGKDKFQDGRGETEAKTTSIQGFFATGGQIRFTGVAGYGWTNLDTDRVLPSLARTASSSPDASVWAIAGRVSAPFQVANNMTLSPYGQLDGQWASVDGYGETGAGAVGLVVPDHDYNTSALELGAALSAPFGSQATPMTARLQAGWRHALNDGQDSLPLAFIGSPVGFVQQIPGVGSDAAHIDASITGAFGPRLTASAGYRGFIGGGDSAHAIEVRLKYAM